MDSTFYLSRSLSHDEKIYTEAALLTDFKYVVVLAEPGAGKTKFMNSLAQQLGTTVVTANKFASTEVKECNSPLLVDAFDELAKIDVQQVHKIFAKAQEANPTHVYLSGRSSEWDAATTNAFMEHFKHEPTVIRLCEFDEKEQQLIFNHHVQGESFKAFQAELARFDLAILLPNPQFLQLFADAYMESNKHFTNKQSIFAQAIERLAKEANRNITENKPTLSSREKITLSSEVFAKLLLSGAEGVCTNEAAESLMYPSLTSLFNSNVIAGGILATRLFKLGDDTGQHRPVHKIVAEYCAADYLTKRITSASDSLTINKCLAVIAPNSTVRYELRGLLGWIAALGCKSIEEPIIRLDPYAVLANGDPSQLEHSSKCLLLKQLVKTEERDPYFRRGDSWRKFSVTGFFTPDVIEEIKPLLTTRGNGHLRDLLLEMLVGSPAIERLSNELRQLVLTPVEDTNTRLLANKCLLGITGYDHYSNLGELIKESSDSSLEIAENTIKTLAPETFDKAYLASFFRAYASQSLDYENLRDGIIGRSDSVNFLIAELGLSTIEWLLNELTKDITCTCGKEFYSCHCRTGISEIIGLLLDHYFELATPPFEPLRVWQWLKNLNFQENKPKKESKTVQVLQEDDGLRQAINTHIFGGLTESKDIRNALLAKINSHPHPGLRFCTHDYKFIVDLAFENNNMILWKNLIPSHQHSRYNGERGPNEIRRHMREQTLTNSAFMSAWAKVNRAEAKHFKRKIKPSYNKRLRKVNQDCKKQSAIHAVNIKYIQDNRKLIEAGEHWEDLKREDLKRFSWLLLQKPDQIKVEFGDEVLVRSALRNCLDFINPHIPELAEIGCASNSRHTSLIILYAACLEIMRFQGNLESVDSRLLKALRTCLNTHYSAVSEKERKALKAEVDRIIFFDASSAEKFLREYLEPQLEQVEYDYPQVYLLSDEEVFRNSAATLSLEWLNRFPNLSLNSLTTLFNITVQFDSNRDDLKKIIGERCEKLMSDWPNQDENESVKQKRSFWLVRACYFLNCLQKKYWDYLKEDKNTVFAFIRCNDAIRWDNLALPKLTSLKVEAILDAFIDMWPKVDLPESWGSGSPKEEEVYRFLTEVIWSINSDKTDDAIPVLKRLLTNKRFADLHKDLKNIQVHQIRNKALRDFTPPTPQHIVNLLDHGTVVTVGGLRQLVIQELQNFQNDIDGGEYDPADRFYEKDEHLDEVRSTKIIAERLSLRLEPQNVSVTIEHQLKNKTRCDITATKMIDGEKRLLVIEVKGQWHGELYTAAKSQLHERYSIHPNAEQQGVFLVIWFGADDKVANQKKHGIKNARKLKTKIEAELPQELAGLVDIFVLDVSRTNKYLSHDKPGDSRHSL